MRLAICQGNEVPPALVEGWKAYDALSPGLQSAVWQLVVSGILKPDDPINRTLVEAFVEDEGVPSEMAGALLQACGFVITQACAQDVGVEALAHDLHQLSGGESTGSRLLLSVVETEKPKIRETLLRQTLSDHGNVLISLDWRVDQVAASNRGTRLDASVVFLTLAYLNGEERNRLSLQVTPEGLKDLRTFLAQFD